jgi:hypothetical protein
VHGGDHGIYVTLVVGIEPGVPLDDFVLAGCDVLKDNLGADADKEGNAVRLVGAYGLPESAIASGLQN